VASTVARDDKHMSPRARAYIAFGGFRHTATGLTMLALPWLYSSAVFLPIFNVFGGTSIAVWGWTMVAIGVVCYAGAILGNPTVSRYGIAASAAITSILAVALTLGLVGAWTTFAGQLHTGELWQLIAARPAKFPTELLERLMPPPSPLLMIAFLSFGGKDFTMCAQPLRVPLEDRRIRAVLR
jgi:hypothetical protein